MKSIEQLLISKSKEYPLLTKEKIYELIKKVQKYNQLNVDSKKINKKDMDKIKDDAMEARDIICYSNIRLVMSIANRYKIPSSSYNDLVNEGFMGLQKAIEQFDITFDKEFSTYATYWITHYIQRYICDYHFTIRIPVHARTEMNRLNREIENYQLDHNGLTPSDEELSVLLNCNVKRVRELKKYSNQSVIVSLNTPVGDDQCSELMDVTDFPDAQIENDINYDISLKMAIETCLSLLNDKEQQVIIYRYGLFGNDEETLDAIGKRYGLTRERIRQIEAKALKKIRAHCKIDNVNFKPRKNNYCEDGTIISFQNICKSKK